MPTPLEERITTVDGNPTADGSIPRYVIVHRDEATRATQVLDTHVQARHGEIGFRVHNFEVDGVPLSAIRSGDPNFYFGAGELSPMNNSGIKAQVTEMGAHRGFFSGGLERLNVQSLVPDVTPTPSPTASVVPPTPTSSLGTNVPTERMVVTSGAPDGSESGIGRHMVVHRTEVQKTVNALDTHIKGFYGEIPFEVRNFESGGVELSAIRSGDPEFYMGIGETGVLPKHGIKFNMIDTQSSLYMGGNIKNPSSLVPEGVSAKAPPPPMQVPIADRTTVLDGSPVAGSPGHQRYIVVHASQAEQAIAAIDESARRSFGEVPIRVHNFEADGAKFVAIESGDPRFSLGSGEMQPLADGKVKHQMVSLPEQTLFDPSKMSDSAYKLIPAGAADGTSVSGRTSVLDISPFRDSNASGRHMIVHQSQAGAATHALDAHIKGIYGEIPFEVRNFKADGVELSAIRSGDPEFYMGIGENGVLHKAGIPNRPIDTERSVFFSANEKGLNKAATSYLPIDTDGMVKGPHTFAARGMTAGMGMSAGISTFALVSRAWNPNIIEDLKVGGARRDLSLGGIGADSLALTVDGAALTSHIASRGFANEAAGGQVANSGLTKMMAGVANIDDAAQAAKFAGTLGKFAKGAGPAGMVLSVGAGGFEYYAAKEAGDGHRAARARGGTAGGVIGAGFGIGVGLLSGVGTIPTLAIVTTGALGGSFGGAKLDEALNGEKLQAKFDAKTQTAVNSIVSRVGAVSSDDSLLEGVTDNVAKVEQFYSSAETLKLAMAEHGHLKTEEARGAIDDARVAYQESVEALNETTTLTRAQKIPAWEGQLEVKEMLTREVSRSQWIPEDDTAAIAANQSNIERLSQVYNETAVILTNNNLIDQANKHENGYSNMFAEVGYSLEQEAKQRELSGQVDPMLLGDTQTENQQPEVGDQPNLDQPPKAALSQAEKTALSQAEESGVAEQIRQTKTSTDGSELSETDGKPLVANNDKAEAKDLGVRDV